MPQIPVDPSCVVEEEYSLPSSHIENFYAEPVDQRFGWPWRLVPTPGLTAFSDYTGGSAGRGCFQSDVIASGSIITAHSTQVYKTDSAGVSTAITGSIVNDSKPIAFALSQTQAVICSGGVPYTVTGSAVTSIAAALTAAGASGAIIDVAVVNNRFLYAEDNSGRVFYSDPGAAGTIGGFFTAERDPDQIRALLVVGSNLLAMGTRKTEVWTGTDSSTIPFIQRQGMVFEYGVIGSSGRAQIGSAAYWVAHDNTVRRWAGAGAEEISQDWLVRQIESLTQANKALVRVTAHIWRGHQFVKVFIPGKGSYFYNAKMATWHRRRDLGDELAKEWGFDYFVEAFGNVYVQKLTNGRLYKLDAAAFKEDGIEVRRVATFFVPVKTPTTVNILVIEGQAGAGLDASGVEEDDNPKVMLRTSLDGHTFGDELTAEIGRRGAYRWRPVFGSQATFYPPLAKIEIAYSAAVGWPIYGATYNERVA